MTTFTLRPVTYADADALYALTTHATVGLTSLPLTMAHCLQKIEISLRTWENPHMPGGSYWFALVENASNIPIGSAMIIPKSGQDKPILSFQRETIERHSHALDIHTQIDILHLCQWQHQPTELCGLFLHPDYRKSGVGRLLSLGRLMAIAMAPQHFDVMVIAQMRGVIDDNGNAPFWENVCQKLCPISFQDLDKHLRKRKQFLIDMLPQIPIYIYLMPPEVQAILGKIHPKTQGAAHILGEEGFTATDHIDVGDAGPIVSAPRDEIRIIRDSRKVRIIEIYHGSNTTPKNPDAVDCLLSVQTPTGVRITQASVSKFLDYGLGISPEVAQSLGVSIGQTLWIAPVKSHPFMRRFSEWFTTLATGQTTSPFRAQAPSGKQKTL